MDNLDPVSFATLLDKLPLATSRFVAISKSGGTGETLDADHRRAVGAGRRAAQRPHRQLMLGLSEPAKPGKRNGLRDLLAKYNVPMLDHHTGVGGRFSVLTNVGLLPAALLGLDIAAIRQGAARALAPVLAKKKAADVPAALGAALSVAAAESKGKSITVLMAYADKLANLTRWYVQLWAESLGKGGKGTTPIAALGPVDQHSQLQLFIAGPRDKLFTVITTERTGLVRASIRNWRSLPASRGLATKPSAIWSPRRAARRRDLGQERLPGAHHSSAEDRRSPSRRTADAFHA